PAKRPASQRGNDLLCASGFLIGAGGPAAEDQFSAGRIRRLCLERGASVRFGRIARTLQPDLAYVRVERETWKAPGLNGAPQKMLVEIVSRRIVGRQERDAYGMQTALDRHA